MLKWNTRLIASVASFFICLHVYFLLYTSFFFCIMWNHDNDSFLSWYTMTSKKETKIDFSYRYIFAFSIMEFKSDAKLLFWWYDSYSVSWNMCARHKNLPPLRDKLPTIIHLNCGIYHSFLMAQWRRDIMAAHLKYRWLSFIDI